ncbi:MAG: polysaccharide lyase [Leptospiraceae bacterium]
MKRIALALSIIWPGFFFVNCSASGADGLDAPALLALAFSGREFRTSFESLSEFDGSYIVPQNYQSAASHELSTERLVSGTSAHKGWIYSTAADSHRAYPTVQFHKLEGGSFTGLVYIELQVYLQDIVIPTGSGHWFSFITVARRTEDAFWDGVLVNLGYEGIVHLMHVPTVGKKEWTYQSTDLFFPQNQWVKLGLCLSMDSENGFARAYQDGVLVSAAPVSGFGDVPQVHFGLYAHKDMNQGIIYNDDLLIKEVLFCP